MADIYDTLDILTDDIFIEYSKHYDAYRLVCPFTSKTVKKLAGVFHYRDRISKLIKTFTTYEEAEKNIELFKETLTADRDPDDWERVKKPAETRLSENDNHEAEEPKEKQ